MLSTAYGAQGVIDELVRREEVDTYNVHGDCPKTYLVALQWVGFDKAFVDVERHVRFVGRSSYGVFRLLKQPSPSRWPTRTGRSMPLCLYASIYAGAGITFTALLASTLVVFQYFSKGALDGWSRLMVAVLYATKLRPMT